MSASINMNEVQMQLVMTITGGNGGTMKGEDGKDFEWANVDALQPIAGDNAFGAKTANFKCDPKAYERIKQLGQMKYLCSVTMRTSTTTGSSIRILDAVPADPLPSKAK